MTSGRALLCVALALASAGCSAATPKTPAASPRSPLEDLVALVPLGANVVATLDVKRLRASPIARDFIAKGPLAEKLALPLGVDWLRDVDTAVLAVTYAPGPDLLALARGKFDSERIRFAVLERKGATVAEQQGIPVFEAQDGAIGLLSPQTLALGSRHGIHQVIRVLRGEVRSVREHAELMEFFGGPAAEGRATLRAAAVFDESLKRTVEREYGHGSAIRRVAARVDLDSGLDGALTSEFLAPAAAGAFESEVRSRAGAVRRRIALFGLGSALDGLLVQTSGSRVLVQLQIPPRDLERLLDLVSGGWQRQGDL